MLTMQVLIKCLVLVSSFVNFIFASPSPDASTPAKSRDCIKPKVVIISLFDPEAEVWYGIKDFDLLAQNITIPGLSPLFPDVHCTKNEEICQVITGEAEINAATTITALSVSPRFDLTSTYFLVAGISGINPSVGTINDVTFARFAIQVALQYEFDSREIPRNFSTGYVPLGATDPEQYPQNIYGTEVFELNGELQKIAVDFAKKAKLNDSDIAQSYRSNYIQSAAKLGPSVHACDVATSDVYFSGDLLGEAFTNFTDLVTNGTALYCTTAQEDNATLEALIRAAIYKLVDFSRIIVMRTASDFDRPFAGEPDTVNLFYADQGAFEPSVSNIYLAGREVISGIISNWEGRFKAGIKPSNYIGDIFGSLGGTPDFGLPSEFLSNQDSETPLSIRKRSILRGGAAGHKRARPGAKVYLPSMPLKA